MIFIPDPATAVIDPFVEISPQRISHALDTRQGEWNTGLDNGCNTGFEIPHKGGYHIAAPGDIGYNLRSKMCMTLEEWGVKVKYHHHEVGGSGQMEIEVELGDMIGIIYLAEPKSKM